MTARRIRNDVEKAVALSAGSPATNVTSLWIVTPSNRVARSVRRKLCKLGTPEQRPWICAFVAGRAMQEIAGDFPLFSGALREGKERWQRNGTP